MLDDILKVVQEALPKLQSDAVLKRLQEADAADKEVASLKTSLDSKVAAIERLGNIIKDFEGRTTTKGELVAIRANLDSERREFDIRVAVLDAVSNERSRSAANTHELLLTLFKNTTVRRDTAQAIVLPTYSQEYNNNQGGTLHQQSGAYTDTVPITETTTEE